MEEADRGNDCEKRSLTEQVVVTKGDKVAREESWRRDRDKGEKKESRLSEKREPFKKQGEIHTKKKECKGERRIKRSRERERERGKD